MIREQVSIDEVVALLNDALALDPSAVSNLVSVRVECNQALGGHPTIQAALADGTYRVGILGMLNGLFGTDERGYGPIAATVEDDLVTVVAFGRCPEPVAVLAEGGAPALRAG